MIEDRLKPLGLALRSAIGVSGSPFSIPVVGAP
jgi:hypothetical protein